MKFVIKSDLKDVNLHVLNVEFFIYQKEMFIIRLRYVKSEINDDFFY